MSKIVTWLREASTRVLDPQREQRIAWFSQEIARLVKNQRGAFDLSEALNSLGVEARDVRAVKDHVYEAALERTWQDHAITADERKGLDWIAKVLDMDSSQVRSVELNIGTRVFGDYLARVLSDGRLSDTESKTMAQIADGLNTSVRKLVMASFQDWGEGFLRSLFAKTVADGGLDDEEWQQLVGAAQGLGLTHEELLQAIEPQAKRFVEHALADAKSDERLTLQEDETLNALLARFRLTPDFKRYVENQLSELRLLTAIGEGRLPVVENAQVALRSGELVHFQATATYCRTRILKSGPRVDAHDGNVTITDYRLIFDSAAFSAEVSHRKVIDVGRYSCGFELRTSGRGAGTYGFSADSRLAFAIYAAAIRRANRTLVAQESCIATRHIPRDVRQRVWQRYGGRCAECGSDQYLEFDHIVPVAKGGSNSDKNVQLLCRGCNLRKSDRI